MRAVLIALPFFIVFFGGWLAHAWLVRRKSPISKQEKIELEAWRQLDDRLLELAMDHLEIDPFAVIVLDEVRKTQKQIMHDQIDVLHRKEPS